MLPLDELNNQALAVLNDSRLSILPVNCQKHLKKLICSSTYLKCSPKANLSSTFHSSVHINSAFQFINKNRIPMATLISPNESLNSFIKTLPYQYPCREVCDDTVRTCLGFLSLLGIDLNCDATNFDPTNDPQRCNPVTAKVAVGSLKEPYLKANDPSGACYGITEMLFVPPSNTIDASLAPMQPPYVTQGVIEDTLSDAL